METRQQREKIGAHIREARLRNGLTQKELVEQFAKYVGRNTPFSVSTLSNWESGAKLPRDSMRRKLADFLCVEKDYFFDNDMLYVRRAKPGMVKETEETLRSLGGEPVWCEFETQMQGGGAFSRWGIVDAVNRKIVFGFDFAVDFADVDFTVYRHPLPFAYAPDATERPLDIKGIREAEKVWIEPVGGEFDTRQKLKEYGKFDETKKAVIGDSGNVWPLEQYAKMFLCFLSPVKYDPNFVLSAKELQDESYEDDGEDDNE